MTNRILCFGDSNTWGYYHKEEQEFTFSLRYPWEIRYPGVLQKLLGEGWRIIEEGHNGRTSVFDDPVELHRNGRNYLQACLESHMPLDLVLIMLGTNDMKPRVAGRAFDSATGVGKLGELIQHTRCGRRGGTPKLLLVSPVAIGENIMATHFCEEFGPRSHEESLLLPGYLRAVAAGLQCEFLDAAQVARVGEDQVHMDAENHKKLAEALAQKLREMLPAK